MSLCAPCRNLADTTPPHPPLTKPVLDERERCSRCGRDRRAEVSSLMRSEP